MFSFFIFLAFLLSFLFPYFLIQAIRLPEKNDKKGFFVIAACLSFGFIFVILEVTLMSTH